MEDLLTVLIIFLAGVGVGTFVLGSRIRQIVAEAVLVARAEGFTVRTEIKAEEAKAKDWLAEVWNAITGKK